MTKLVQACAVNLGSLCLCNSCVDDQEQVCDQLQSVAVFKGILVHQDAIKREQDGVSVLLVRKCGQVSNWVQFICYNMAIKSNKQSKSHLCCHVQTQRLRIFHK